MQYQMNVLVLTVCTIFVVCTMTGHVRGSELSRSGSFRGDTRLKRSSGQENER